MSRNKDIGDRAEREAVELLRALGLDAVRTYNAGQPDDSGDVIVTRRNGLTPHDIAAVQVKCWEDFGDAVMASAHDGEQQAARYGRPFGVGLVKRKRARDRKWVVTMTPETFAWLVKAVGR